MHLAWSCISLQTTLAMFITIQTLTAEVRFAQIKNKKTIPAMENREGPLTTVSSNETFPANEKVHSVSTNLRANSPPKFSFLLDSNYKESKQNKETSKSKPSDLITNTDVQVLQSFVKKLQNSLVTVTPRKTTAQRHNHFDIKNGSGNKNGLEKKKPKTDKEKNKEIVYRNDSLEKQKNPENGKKSKDENGVFRNNSNFQLQKLENANRLMNQNGMINSNNDLKSQRKPESAGRLVNKVGVADGSSTRRVSTNAKKITNPDAGKNSSTKTSRNGTIHWTAAKRLDGMSNSDMDALLAIAKEWKRLNSTQTAKSRKETKISDSKYLLENIIRVNPKINAHSNHQTGFNKTNLKKMLNHSSLKNDKGFQESHVQSLPSVFKNESSVSLADPSKQLKETVEKAIVNTTQQLMQFLKLEKQLNRPHDNSEKTNNDVHYASSITKLIGTIQKSQSPNAEEKEKENGWNAKMKTGLKIFSNHSWKLNGSKIKVMENRTESRLQKQKNIKLESAHDIAKPNEYLNNQYGHQQDNGEDQNEQQQQEQQQQQTSQVKQNNLPQKVQTERENEEGKIIPVQHTYVHQQDNGKNQDEQQQEQQQRQTSQVKQNNLPQKVQTERENEEEKIISVQHTYGHQQDNGKNQNEQQQQQEQQQQISQVKQNNLPQKVQTERKNEEEKIIAVQHTVQEQSNMQGQKINAEMQQGALHVANNITGGIAQQQRERGESGTSTLTQSSSNNSSLQLSEQQVLKAARSFRLKTMKHLIASLTENPFNSWIYHQNSFDELGITPSLLKSGIANLGSSKAMRSVVQKAVKGKTIKMMVVGGSISAGGGLWKDRGNIDGVYHKALSAWWRKTVTPITNSTIDVNNVAIGGIDSEYFSYCLNNFLESNPDLVLWELSANDYNLKYDERDFDPSKALEQLTRLILQLPSHPALIYVNFFRGDSKHFELHEKCPDSEQAEVDILSRYYDIPSLSWRRMVCNLITKRTFIPRELFSEDGVHPSLLGHAQVAMLLTMYIKGVFESVLADDLENAEEFNDEDDDFGMKDSESFQLKIPAFKDPLYPQPRCWTLLTPDYTKHYRNTLDDVNVLKGDGFELKNVTAWDVRTDRCQCLLATKLGATLDLSLNVPVLDEDKNLPLAEAQTRTLAIATHNQYGGAADVQLDELPSKMSLKENGSLKNTKVHIVSDNIRPGVHNLQFRSLSSGFCLTSIMVL